MNMHSWLSDGSSWLWPNVWAHLWEATLFVGLLALAVWFLRRAPASARYWFWLLAAVKLLVPSLLLAWLVSEMAPAPRASSALSLELSTHRAPSAALAMPSYEILKPLLPSPPVAAQPVSAAAHNELYCALTLTWLAGFGFFVVRWVKGSVSLARAVRTSRRIVSSRETEILKRVRARLGLKQEVDILVSAHVTEAGLWGIWRPKVLLPEGAASRLSDEELEAVILHELIHVRRRDNLAVVLQKSLFSLLWFCPLVWLVDRKLFEERERACDEEVVRLRQSPETYISGILKVVRACVEQRLVGTSSIGGSRLKSRMVHLLSTRLPRKLGFRECVLIIGFVAGLAIFSVGVVFVNRDAYAAWSTPAGQGPVDQNPGVIQGRVIAEDGGSPLARATLSLRSRAASPYDPPRTARTDSRGEYTFRDLEAGQYILRATRHGYIPRNYGQKTSYSLRIDHVGTALTVGPGQVLENIDIRLIRGGVVEGRVVDQDKEPVERVAVRLTVFRSLGGKDRLLPSGHDETDDRGYFRIFGVPPGDYYLRVSPRPLFGDSRRPMRSFAPTYYPGVLSVEEAATIKMTAGEEAGGFNITVIEGSSYSVSGRVLTPEGTPAHSVWIVSMKQSGKEFPTGMGPNTNTDLQGHFKVSGLLPGGYRLYARSGSGEDQQLATADVEVVDQDLSGLTLMLAKGADITGRIVVEGEASAVDWRRIFLDLSPSKDNPNRLSFGGIRASVEKDLTFRIANHPEGSHHLMVMLPPGNHYVSSIRLEGQDIADRPIELKRNDRLEGVEIHIASDGAQLSGGVAQAEGQEVAEGTTVLAFAADPQRRNFPSRFTKTTQTDQSGQFSLEGLAPGKYLVCALVDHQSGNEWDADYLKGLEEDSEEIDLPPGQTLEESLVALPAPKTN